MMNLLQQAVSEVPKLAQVKTQLEVLSTQTKKRPDYTVYYDLLQSAATSLDNGIVKKSPGKRSLHLHATQGLEGLMEPHEEEVEFLDPGPSYSEEEMIDMSPHEFLAINVTQRQRTPRKADDFVFLPPEIWKTLREEQKLALREHNAKVRESKANKPGVRPLQPKTRNANMHFSDWSSIADQLGEEGNTDPTHRKVNFTNIDTPGQKELFKTPDKTDSELVDALSSGSMSPADIRRVLSVSQAARAPSVQAPSTPQTGNDVVVIDGKQYKLMMSKIRYKVSQASRATPCP